MSAYVNLAMECIVSLTEPQNNVQINNIYVSSVEAITHAQLFQCHEHGFIVYHKYCLDLSTNKMNVYYLVREILHLFLPPPINFVTLSTDVGQRVKDFDLPVIYQYYHNILV